jgi:tetratricopeptide (TPR) repeat protein
VVAGAPAACVISAVHDARRCDPPCRAGTPRRALLLAMVAAALSAPVAVLAQMQYSAQEVAMLPSYCQSHPYVTKNGSEAEIQRWKSAMGDVYQAIHHYCWAQIATNRAKLSSRSRQERMRWLNQSIGDFDYVLQYAPRDFPLLPEILTRKGENLIGLGNAAPGVTDLQRAIEVKPDYWPPYAILSDYFKSVGDRAKAKEWLDKGLSQSPDAKALKRRLAELDAPQGKARASPKRPKVPATEEPAGR